MAAGRPSGRCARAPARRRPPPLRRTCCSTRLLAAGYETIIWNRSPASTAPLVKLGARAVTTPAEAARQADTLITMVADPPALRAVTEGADGIAAGARASLTVIEMSTVWASRRDPSRPGPACRDGLLDAPVIGSLAGAESGWLTILVGGPAPIARRAVPLLSAFGTAVHVGALGTGAAAKLVANLTFFDTLGTLSEAIALARGLGLSDEATFRGDLGDDRHDQPGRAASIGDSARPGAPEPRCARQRSAGLTAVLVASGEACAGRMHASSSDRARRAGQTADGRLLARSCVSQQPHPRPGVHPGW